MLKDNYQLLLEKLDQFIRKFYINQLIRGFLYTSAVVIGLFVLFNILEYYFFFGTGVRKTMFYTFLTISGVSIFNWLLLPAMHYFRLGNTISHEQAAVIIGKHFQNVQDKLLNILQLRQQAGNQATDTSLVMASINQKSEEIKIVPFKAAINLAQNKKYLWYAMPPFLILLMILFINAKLIKDSTNRLINNNKVYEREAPFQFIIEEKDLRVVQFNNYDLRVKVQGDVLPNEVFLNLNGYQYKLTPQSKDQFTYTFNNVQKETPFQLSASGFNSKEYLLDVLKKPIIQNFDIKLNYPAYTERSNETIANIGDIVVPIGTDISWLFASQNADNISIQFGPIKDFNIAKTGDDRFSHKKRALRDETYKVYVSNAQLNKADSVQYAITVIPDLHPTINAQRFQDSLNKKILYFVGDAGDDYGIRSLTFNYSVQKQGSNQSQTQNIPMTFKANSKQTPYQYTWDLEKMGLKPGDKLTYYFEVFDNDAVNGSKAARTDVMTYAMPTVEEFEKLEDDNSEQIKDQLEKSKKESEKIKEDMKKLREKLLQEKEVDWQTRKEIEKMLERQRELEKEIEKAKEKFEENIKNQNEFSQPQQEILEKQQQLQKMFDEMMSDEMKELMKKMEELLEQMNKENTFEELKNFEMKDDKLNKELDRMLELYKQMEMQHELEQQVEKLEKLSEEQEKLAKENEQNKQDSKNAEEKQKDINKEFDKVQEKMKDIEKKNEELENKKDLKGTEEDMKDIDKEMEDSQQQLKEQQNSKASKSQKKAAQKMKQLAQKMQQQMQAQQMEQAEEDIKMLRQLLENLITLSFEQEGVMKELTPVATNTPKYTQLVQQQYKIKDDFKVAEDSLQALSKRVFQIQSFVTEKVTEIKSNISNSLEQLEERQKSIASVHQQTAMRSLNDLALMLSETMNQMQQQMASGMSGAQMCQKPGDGKGNKKGNIPKNLGAMQQELNQQMQKMRDQMGKQGQGGMSKEFAEMAARQAAIRKKLNDIQKERQQQGQGADKELQKTIDEMDKTETELVNKRLSNDLMNRQQNIMTRLLEHEKAQRQQEQDEKRKAEQPQEKERKMPAALEDYIKKREAEIDLYKSVSPALKPYYKNLVEQYYQKLKKQ